MQEGANVTHIVGKLDNVLQKVADNRQEVISNAVVLSPQVSSSQLYQRQRSSVDATGLNPPSGVGVVTTHPTPLKERIEQMRLSVSEQGAPQVSYSRSPSRDQERNRKSSSITGSSGEHQLPGTAEEASV